MSLQEWSNKSGFGMLGKCFARKEKERKKAGKKKKEKGKKEKKKKEKKRQQRPSAAAEIVLI